MSLQLPSFDGPDTEAERIALRRVAEASRRTRVLDSRARTLGVDVAYLQQQVEERRAAARAEAEEDLARATADREAFLAVAEAEATEEVERRARDAANAAVWEGQLDRSGRPEADLVPEFNPSQPVDVDACGPSAAQCFAGEGSGLAQLRRTQAAQQKKWLDEQTRERRAAAARQAEEDAAFDAGLTEVVGERAKAEADEEAERIATRRALQAANQDLAAARREQRAAEAAAHAAAAAAENEAVAQSAFLSETSEVVGPAGRVRRDMFKGLGQQVVYDTLTSNAELLADAAARDAESRAEEQEMAATIQVLSDARREEEADDAVRQLEARLALKEHHAIQAAEARARSEESKSTMHGTIDEAYFAPFGRSAR